MRIFQCVACSLEFEAPHASGPLPRWCAECIVIRAKHVQMYRKNRSGVKQRALAELRATNESRLTEFVLVAKQAQALIYMGRGAEAYDLLGDVLERRAPRVIYIDAARAV